MGIAETCGTFGLSATLAIMVAAGARHVCIVEQIVAVCITPCPHCFQRCGSHSSRNQRLHTSTSIYPYIYLSICMSKSIYLFIYLYIIIFLSVCLCIKIFLSVYQTLSIYIYIYISIYQSIYPYVYLSESIYLFIYLSSVQARSIGTIITEKLPHRRDSYGRSRRWGLFFCPIFVARVEETYYQYYLSIYVSIYLSSYLSIYLYV